MKTSIELFAGAGGLALGIEKAGFTHLGLIEKDEDAVATMQHNRPDWHVIAEDITVFSQRNLTDYFHLRQGELDLLSGGPPCQPFSVIGRKRGLDDARGTMFYYYAEFLRQLQPKMFIFENVPGLVAHDKGNTFAVITATFAKLGYYIQHKVLNAWDYGCPQKRKRCIVIGVRNNSVFAARYNWPRPHEYKPILRDVLTDCPPSDIGAHYSSKEKQAFALVPPGGNWRDIPENVVIDYMGASFWRYGGGKSGTLRRFSMNEPSSTITARVPVWDRWTGKCHPTEVRPFTVRECARIQTFPDDWEFIGKVDSQYRQVGNAVPVSLAYDTASEVYKALARKGIEENN